MLYRDGGLGARSLADPAPCGTQVPGRQVPAAARAGRRTASTVLEADAVPWEWLGAVHEAPLLERIRTGTMSLREQRGLGLPWSEVLVERGRRSVGGTVAAARRALERRIGMNLGGGTHHAGRDFARGYCLFNDVVVTLEQLRAEGLVRRALVVDCDVHQGDGTAQLLGPDPDAFCLSLHGARNYPFERIPSDLDVDLAVGHRRRRVPAGALGRARRRDPRRAAGDRVLPGRRGPLGGRPAGPPGADQGRPAGARRARPRPAAGDRRGGRRGARRRLRAGRRATPSTSTPRRSPRSPRGTPPKLVSVPGA